MVNFQAFHYDCSQPDGDEKNQIVNKGYFWIKQQILRAKNMRNMSHKVQRIDVWNGSKFDINVRYLLQ